jgi:hypothetical protein
MSAQLAVVPALDDGPVHRSIVAVDVEGSTKRTNPDKGKLRRVLYDLLERALTGAGIGQRHLEELGDRGDGVLILIRPHDDVPKTVLFSQLIPKLTALLVEYNEGVAKPELRMRLRAVIHAGEVHEDGRGFYGDDIDVAFRLLEARKVKLMLKHAPEAPLVLVVSEEIWTGVLRHGYSDCGRYSQRVRVQVGERTRYGRVTLPTCAQADVPARVPRPRQQPSLALAPATPNGTPAEWARAEWLSVALAEEEPTDSHQDDRPDHRHQELRPR